MINELICRIIKSLNIDCYYLEANCKKDKYVIFSIYNESELEKNLYDDNYIAITYNIQLSFWYKNPQDAILYQEIKNRMKENGFYLKTVIDRKESEMYGKTFDFLYEKDE
ncbi:MULTISPECIES: hypothetical protein [Clostridioides]|uniref:hypothetical protein n=1 Tax=Clostridioides sp. ZZV14-6387 TaxID=2811497 RepID=UPI0007BB1B48|nr:hypothetical protein [Clostridioides sp. ZZV14-6387]CZR95559.1 hypothetical protein CDFC105_60347 [Clostridioides difficile]CZR99855.1 hypothetical protein CDFC105_70058 [Clostridioides difficile]